MRKAHQGDGSFMDPTLMLLRNIDDALHHYWLTRQLIQDYVNNTGCFDVDLDTLMDNQVDLGANFALLTNNKKAGDKLTAALKEHINIAVKIVVAANNGKDITSLYKEWAANATLIARIYHRGWNPLDKKKMDSLMQTHLATTLNEASAIIKKDCQASYDTAEIALKHINMMSDYIGSKFKC